MIESFRTTLFVVFLLYFSSARTDTAVKVYDSVLSDETREKMHQACVEWPGDDVVFVFPLAQPEKHSFLEQTLNSILLQLYPSVQDPLYYVEYWARQEWYHILAHADMDEGLRREQEAQGLFHQPFGHPQTGHVLYLKLGNQVKGPTCVFDNTTFGADLADDKRNRTHSVIVPAVESRLLRFQGHLLHAVPRPADLWIVPTYEDETEPFEKWGRSVLLFNTWPIAAGTVREKQIRNETSASEKEKENTDMASCKDKSEW